MKIAIIQARMGSSRLSGKVMMNICGKPVLQHVIDRVKGSKYVDKIIIATSVEPINDRIRDYCFKNNLLFFSGSEDDVLDRYYQTAKINKVNHDDIIIRITADCPLIDPEIIDKVIETHQSENADYTANVIKPTFPDGLDCEVMNFSILNKVWESAELKSEREHVTLYIRNHPELFKIVSVENDLDFSFLRWTLDEKEDLDLIKVIYENLYENNQTFLMRDILNLINKIPELKIINSMYVRNEGLLKSLVNDRETQGE